MNGFGKTEKKVAVAFILFAVFTLWYNNPNKSEQKIDKEVHKNYNKNKSILQFYAQKLRASGLNSNCKKFILSYNRNSEVCSQQPDVVYDADVEMHGLTKERAAFLNDFMSDKNIAQINVWEDSILFSLNNIAYDNNFASIIITNNITKQIHQLDTNAYYRW